MKGGAAVYRNTWLGLCAIALMSGDAAGQAGVRPIGPGASRDIGLSKAIDAFWAVEFQQAFPGSPTAYQSPRVRFHAFGRHPSDTLGGASGGYYFDQQWGLSLARGYQAPTAALILAHEFGHHVQNLIGRNRWIKRKSALQPRRAAEFGMRYELEAECLAGVWAHHAVRDGRHLSRADVARWRSSYERIADTSTHGTGMQQRRWFDRGYALGRARDCDTYSPPLAQL